MNDGSRRLQTYLAQLRLALRGLPPAEVADIAAEIESHVRDACPGGLSDGEAAAVLARLGKPAELGSLYVTERLMARAASGGSPWLVVRAVARWAAASVAGSLALVGLLAGCFVGASFLVAALVKPFAPHRVGLWRLPGGEVSLHLGLVAPPPPQGEELLGWWIVPLGLALGAGVLWLLPRMARWAIRRFGNVPRVPSRRRADRS